MEFRSRKQLKIVLYLVKKSAHLLQPLNKTSEHKDMNAYDSVYIIENI